MVTIPRRNPGISPSFSSPPSPCLLRSLLAASLPFPQASTTASAMEGPSCKAFNRSDVFDDSCGVVDGLTTNQNPCTQGIFGCSPPPNILFNLYLYELILPFAVRRMLRPIFAIANNVLPAFAL